MSTNILNDYEPLIGFAIATFNRKEVLRECLDAIDKSDYQNRFICVVDDGSSDGTFEMLRADFPHVMVVRGDGNLWWGGATNKAIESCLNSACDYIILLNDDCLIEKDTLNKFLQRSKEYPDAVIAPIAVDVKAPDQVWWAGSNWGPLKYMPYIWLIRQKYPHRTPISDLPSNPFTTSEFTGRGVFIPKFIFDTVGVIDSELFPQYGSDNDFSLRVTTVGNKALVDPNNRVLLYTEEAGQNTSGSLVGLPVRFLKLMFFRKHGEAGRYWWRLLKKHAPWYAIIPSYIFILSLIFLRVFKILPIIYKLVNLVKAKKVS